MRRSENDIASKAPHPTESPESHHLWFADRTTDPKWLNLDDFDLILDAECMSATDCKREIVALVKRCWHLRTAAPASEPGHHSTPLRELGHRSRAWQKFKGCAVTVGADDLPLPGIDTQEAAIARIERHLHGRNEMLAPANYLCRRASD